MLPFSSSRALARLTTTLLACTAPATHAQTPPPTPPTQLPPVLVAGRSSDLVGTATSASQGLVGAAELHSRPLLRRGELLEVIPGVVITQHSGNGKANQYFLRGFNLDHGTDFALSVDGMPVNLRSHAHGQGYADLNFLIPEAVQHVDYNKGPFHADVGDFSAAGAAQFRLVDTFARPFVTLGLGQNHFARFAAGGTLPLRRGTLTGALEASHDDGPWQLPENGRRLSAYLRHAGQAGAVDYRLTALASRGHWTATDPIPLRAVAAGTLDRFGYVDPTDGGTSERLSLSLDATTRGALATTRLNLHAVHHALDLYSNFTYFLDDPVNGDQFNQRDRRWLLGGAWQRTWSGRGAARADTTVGVQARADLIEEAGLYRTAARRRLATVRVDAIDEGSLGLFARHATHWNEWLRSTAGFRYDVHRFDVQGELAANSGARTAGIASPKLSLAFGPWQRTEIYANAGYGFHSNDARGATIRVDPADGVTPVERATPLARSRGAELGVRTTAAAGLVSTLAVWALELDSELVFVGDAGGTEATGATRRYGVELANFYRVAPWCVLDADFAATHARYRKDSGAGTRIANSIATVVTGGVALGRGPGWFGSARLRYYGSQPLLEDNSSRAPSSLTCNLSVGWRTRGWKWTADVANVLDRPNYDIAYRYASRLPGEPAGGYDDLHFHPAEPRTLRVSATRRF